MQSKGKGVVVSYNSMPSSEAVSTNNTIYLNNLANDCRKDYGFKARVRMSGYGS
ncbi:MAG: hypothetical protein M0Q43_01110 [Methanothrix sp.]|nr:hypothetical protein [Methanothrix sp.]